MEIRILGAAVRIPYSFLLLIAALVCFWQFAFFQNAFQWDIHNVMLPWRYFAGENLQNGMLPQWNPYQQFGYPFCSDLQYTNWNAETWIVGNLFGYSYKILYVVIFFYIWMAGTGMYRLSLFFSKKKEIAFFIALSFMLSGCMIAHLQQFNVVMGMVWLPFVIWQFFEFLDKREWKNVFGFSLFSYLQLTSYSALYFMLIYFFIAVLIWKIVKWWRSGEKAIIRQVLFKGLALLFLCGLLLSPVILAAKQAGEFVQRLGTGVSIDEALYGPTTPQSLVSLILPVAAIKNTEWLATDITFANFYFGTIAFVIFIVSLFRKQSSLQMTLLSFITLYLLAAFGDATPVRKFLYDYVPLMNLFRLPGLFRLAVLVFMLMQIAVFLGETEFTVKKLKNILLISTLFFLIGGVVAYLKFAPEKFLFLRLSFREAVRNSAPAELFFIQSVIFAVILGTGYFLCRRMKEINWKIVSIISFLLLFAGIQFNIYVNAADDVKPKHIVEWMKKLPKGFPVPSGASIKETEQFTPASAHLAMNMGNFVKTPMLNDFTSFQFAQYMHLADNKPEVMKQFAYYPLAYLSDTIASLEKEYVAVESGRPLTFSEQKSPFEYMKVSPSDKVVCTKSLPFEFLFHVTNRSPLIFNFIQSWYPGWIITVDGKEIGPLLNAGLMMSVPLGGGVHELSFVYENKAFEITLSISLILFFIVLFLFIWFESKGRIVPAVLVLSAALLPAILFFSRSGKAENWYAQSSRALQTMKKFERYGLFLSKYAADTLIGVSPVHTWSGKDIQSSFRKIRNHRYNKFFLSWYGELPDSRIMEYARYYFPKEKIIYMSPDKLSGAIVLTGNDAPELSASTFEWGREADKQFFSDAGTEVENVGGENVALVKAEQPYGPTFIYDCEKLSEGKDISLRVSFDVLCDTLNPSLFVLAIKDSAEQQVHGRYFKLRPYLISNKDWNHVVVTDHIDRDIKNGYRFSIFLMNTSQEVLRMKNFRIEKVE